MRFEKKIHFHEHFVEEQRRKLRNNDVVPDAAYESLDLALQRRLTQSAAGYLEVPGAVPAQPKATISGVSTKNSGPTAVNCPSDSLFQIKEMFTLLSSRAPIMKKHNRVERHDLDSSAYPYSVNRKATLHAI